MKLLLASVFSLLATGVGFGLAPQDPMEMPKPGPEQAVLMATVGTWDAVVITMGPDGKEARDQGTMTTVKRGEFHTLDTYEGKFMGMDFTGTGINSYCPIRNKYMSTWVDSMAPSPMVLIGDYDKATKTTKMRGECVGMSGKLEPCRTTIQVQDADHYAFEMFGNGPDGKEMRMIRLEYTRKK